MMTALFEDGRFWKRSGNLKWAGGDVSSTLFLLLFTYRGWWFILIYLQAKCRLLQTS